jgi:hypothetical protein
VALDASPYGCGLKAILPIKMFGSGNTIKGITIANGRQTDYSNQYGGGVVFQENCEQNSLIDCVITNCVAARGGGVFGRSHALRCRFTGNRADHGSHAVYLLTAINCIFENTDGYAVYNYGAGGLYLNCLIRNNRSGTFRSTGDPIYVYNSAVILDNPDKTQNRGANFVNCVFNYEATFSHEVEKLIMDESCRILVDGSLLFTAEGVPMSRTPVIGAANASITTAISLLG